MKTYENTLRRPEPGPAFRPYPSRLFVETTTYCNLYCAMCVKHADDSGIVDGHISEETFAALEPAFPHLEALFLNGIGEPLLHPRLDDFIARARALLPEAATIGFQSNGFLLDEGRAERLIGAGLDRICLSIDALAPETFRRVRQGGEVSGFERAFAALRRAKAGNNGSRLRVGAEFVLMRENLRELPEVVRWTAQQGAAFVIVTQMMPYDRAQLGQVAYDPGTDASLFIFEKWRRRAAREGIDLARYREISWRRTDHADRRLIDLVERMKAEARRRDIFLDVKQLLARDDAYAREVAAVLAEAAETARRYGVELKLPAAAPRQERCCPFVEDGGMFVSWNGDVHPCYQLWHRYRCFVNDWERTVQPRVFGRLGRQSLDEIWNGDDFRTFRENVLRYDYPFCANCSVAPCDYIQEEEFVQDCYLKTEPCGACLWASGLLQCLQ